MAINSLESDGYKSVARFFVHVLCFHYCVLIAAVMLEILNTHQQLASAGSQKKMFVCL